MVFHRNKARSSVKWSIRRHISEIPLSTTLNPNQTNNPLYTTHMNYSGYIWVYIISVVLKYQIQQNEINVCEIL